MVDSGCELLTISGYDGHAVFPGLEVSLADKQQWRRAADHSVNGVYWTGTDANGIHWVTDGIDRMAVLPGRSFRFYRTGIKHRLTTLTGRYLRGLVPIPAGAFVINFGANIGEIAVEMVNAGASVMAVEPDSGILPLLRANAAGRNIEVMPFAAWKENAELNLYLNTDSADSSVFNPSDRSTVVTGKTIDALMEERGIERVHLLIGDAEGAEPEVLQGAEKTLRMTEYVSVCASAERCGERTLEACEALLKGKGFNIIFREETGFCTLIARRQP